jgi:GNAT superfamily N-acetyltransferase
VTWAIDALEASALAAATDVLAAACPLDRADVVAAEKLFGPDPTGPARAFAARSPAGELVGVAAIGADRIRVLAVRPEARGAGAGGALLDACTAAIAAAGHPRVRTLDLPGNYLAPGIDERNTDAIAWLGRRGFTALARRNENLLIDVRTNLRVTRDRAAQAAERGARAGYVIRRARPEEGELLFAVAEGFGGAWPWELGCALGAEVPGVHVALDPRNPGAPYAAFAAHDGNNRGLGWFGPAGTWAEHRGKGLGEALLLACLVDVAEHHGLCEVAWIGPREFYDRSAGITDERRFVVMERSLERSLAPALEPA